MDITFHGLGAMGLPMALHLDAAGHAVTGKDPSAAAQACWRQRRQGARPSDRPHGSMPGTAPIVILCVSDEKASRQVIDTEARAWCSGTLVIDHTTTSVHWAQEAHARLAANGISYCDAPLSGGVAGAERGELVAMVGATATAWPLVRATLDASTQSVFHLGEPGAGQACKIAHQIAIAGVAVGLEAARSFARARGLPLPVVFDVLARGTAQSAQLARLHEALSAPDTEPGTLFAWLEKDLALCDVPGTQTDPTTQALITLYRTHLAQPTNGSTP